VNSHVVVKLSISEVPSKIYAKQLMRNLMWMNTYLDDGLLSLDFKDLSFSHDSVSESDIDNFCIFWELYIVQHDKWTFDIKNGSVIDSWCDVIVM
jgi:hypothetical protein